MSSKAPPQDGQVRSVEESLRNFYDAEGWKQQGDQSKDAALWEDTRVTARRYVSDCRLRLCEYLPARGRVLLDAASGPVQYPEYLEYSRGFEKRVCVDLSEEALKQAEARLGPHGDYIKCSILELPLPDDYADATVSLHTIYHIEASAQEQAVRQLLRVTKPGAPLLVVYANPDRISSRIARIFRAVKKSLTATPDAPGEVYYHAHTLPWWKRFSDIADVQVITWRTLTAKLSRRLIPDNRFGVMLFYVLFNLERMFPRASLPFAAYPLIILKKRAD